VTYFGSVNNSGYGLGLGLRSNLIDKVERFGSFDYVDLSDSGSNTSFTLGMGYRLTKRFQLGALYMADQDASGYGIGFRFYFRK